MSASPKSLTVLIAFEHSVTRAGVKASLPKCKTIEADNGHDAVKLAQKHRPQVAIMDTELPSLNGIDAAYRIVSSTCGTRVIMLSEQEDDWHIERANFMGVHGYICASTDISVLPDAIRTVRSGVNFYDAKVLDHLARKSGIPGYAKTPQTPLTSREVEVLQQVIEGLGKKEAATKLGLSTGTVIRHCHTVMKKLRINNIAGMTRYGMRLGITPKK